jgi:hypothetical protein
MSGVRGIDVVLVALGVVGVTIGGALLVRDRPPSRVVLVPRQLEAVAPSTTTTTTPPENPVSFLGLLGAAIRTGDTEFLVSRLHPAVIERFGEATCRAEVATLHDPTSQFTVKSVGTAETWNWTIGKQSTPIANAIPLAVTRVAYGQSLSATVHVVIIDGKGRWFNDCALATGPPPSA